MSVFLMIHLPTIARPVSAVKIQLDIQNVFKIIYTKQTFTYSNSTIKALENKDVKYVQREQ